MAADATSRTASSEASAARLYCLATGIFLCVVGLVGFAFATSFAVGDKLVTERELGLWATNGWDNLAYVLVATALLVGGSLTPPWPARFALIAAGNWLVVCLLGIAATGQGGIPFVAEDRVLLQALPVAPFDNAFHAALAALGFIAWWASRPRGAGSPAAT